MYESELSQVRELDHDQLGRFVGGRLRGEIVLPGSIHDHDRDEGRNAHSFLAALVAVDEVPLKSKVTDAVIVSYFSLWDEAFHARTEDQKSETIDNLQRGAIIIARSDSKELYPAIQNVFENAVVVCEKESSKWNQELLSQAARVFMNVSEGDLSDGKTRKELLVRGLNVATLATGYIWQSLLRTDVGEAEMKELYGEMVHRQETGAIPEIMNTSYFKELMDRKFSNS